MSGWMSLAPFSHVRPAPITYVKAGGLTPNAAVVQPADGRLVDAPAGHQVVAVARPGHRRETGKIRRWRDETLDRVHKPRTQRLKNDRASETAPGSFLNRKLTLKSSEDGNLLRGYGGPRAACSESPSRAGICRVAPPFLNRQPITVHKVCLLH